MGGGGVNVCVCMWYVCGGGVGGIYVCVCVSESECIFFMVIK